MPPEATTVAFPEASKRTESIRTALVLLALGELEPSAGSSLSVLLALDHSGVAGKKSVGAQHGVIGGINLGKRPGKSVSAGSSLSVDAAAENADHDIVLVLARRHDERLPDDSHELGDLEVLGNLNIVDKKFACTFAEENARYRAFPPSSANSKISDH